MPTSIEPMKAVSSDHLPPDDDRWAHEVKWDGYRMIAFVEGGKVRLQTRALLDATAEFPEAAALGPALDGQAVVLDGEIVAFDREGRPSFGALQRRGKERPPVRYVIFDLLHLDGRSTLELPYVDRRRLLDSLELHEGPTWQVPGYHVGNGTALLEATRDQGLEGLMAKRLDSPYLPGKRSPAWLKVKNWGRQEFVVGGWLPGKSGRAGHLGSLLVGYYDDRGELRYAGRVGTGFTMAELDRLAALLAPLERDSSPFARDQPLPREVQRFGHFVEPRLVAEVAFSEWTHTGNIRQPAYKGLRDDKRPEDVVRE